MNNESLKIGLQSYKKINIIFSTLIILIFFYTFLAPYLAITLQSSCNGLPLLYCKSRGLTTAFSQILRINFNQALLLNPYSLKIFLFFLIQLIARNFINFVLNLSNYNKVVKIDIILSSIYFFYSFINLILP